ncbi:MAG TPA: universal stress protein [Tissierellia bacterium]|nr:universal stress protein [Tissierellia bacterium]
MRKILIPIDGSPVSVKAAEKAVTLGKLIDGELTFITVVNMPSEDKYSFFGINVEKQFTANLKEMLKKLIEEETKMLRVVVKNLNTGTLKVEQRVIVGNPAAEIVKLAEEENFEYIFMGRRGFSKAERFFIGSVTQKVIAASPCPVIVVN